MTATELSNLLLLNGVTDPAQLDQLQSMIMTDRYALDNPGEIDGFAKSFKRGAGIGSPAFIEPITTLVVCRGHRTDTLHY